jgi:hypothetical protein
LRFLPAAHFVNQQKLQFIFSPCHLKRPKKLNFQLVVFIFLQLSATLSQWQVHYTDGNKPKHIFGRPTLGPNILPHLHGPVELPLLSKTGSSSFFSCSSEP